MISTQQTSPTPTLVATFTDDDDNSPTTSPQSAEGGIEHFAGLISPAGVMATREEDLKAYADEGKEKGATEQVENGCEERKIGEEEIEWTYPDGGLRAWLVVFVCPFASLRLADES